MDCLPLVHTSLATPTVITCPGGQERPKSWIRDAQKSSLSNSHSQTLQIRMNSFFETCTSKRRLCDASGTKVDGCHASAWVNPRRVEGHQTARPSPGRGTTLRDMAVVRNNKNAKPQNIQSWQFGIAILTGGRFLDHTMVSCSNVQVQRGREKGCG